MNLRLLPRDVADSQESSLSPHLAGARANILLPKLKSVAQDSILINLFILAHLYQRSYLKLSPPLSLLCSALL
jgi:hypothetical protein